MSKARLIVVAGPTAVGKTALSIELAQWLNTEIVSADSRQFYRELNIGTAKPTAAELSQVKHHFINSHSVSDPVNAGRYEKEGIDLLNHLFEKHSQVILCGGSGLFIDAICEGFDELPPENLALRTELSQKVVEGRLNELVEELQKLDPVFAKSVDTQNPQRVIRALEICKVTGRPYSEQLSQQPKQRDFDVIRIALNSDRQELYRKINERVDIMMASGLLEEVKSLREYEPLKPLQTVGYQELFSFLNNEITLGEAVELIKRNSRRYAKRQLTWLRRRDDYYWFQPQQIEDIKSLLAKRITL
ncbi:MAG: tRNA (adenosine(37)-N6)-dimethylallyltransferase MiaA [Flavobacteriales bacterium]|nr:tRNA (adenosine(37)-N6)-dimethylallyltransferase MiaA [Flavobacteriales bacterium]